MATPPDPFQTEPPTEDQAFIYEFYGNYSHLNILFEDLLQLFLLLDSSLVQGYSSFHSNKWSSIKSSPQTSHLNSLSFPHPHRILNWVWSRFVLSSLESYYFYESSCINGEVEIELRLL